MKSTQEAPKEKCRSAAAEPSVTVSGSVNDWPLHLLSALAAMVTAMSYARTPPARMKPTGASTPALVTLPAGHPPGVAGEVPALIEMT